MQSNLPATSNHLNPAQQIRTQLAELNANLLARFHNKEQVEALILERSKHIDQVLIDYLQTHLNQNHSVISACALGGYGRQELFPYSDIDLLFLTQTDLDSESSEVISHLIQILWDAGLQPSPSIQSQAEALKLASNDLNFLSSALDARLLYGDIQQLERFRTALHPQSILGKQQFLQQKAEEQLQRHERFGDTGYCLEPNVKEGPGGIRDLQMVRWIAQSQHQVDTLSSLIGPDLITQSEYQEFRSTQQFLWRVRYTLHSLAGKAEERLIFEYQTKLAELFTYQDNAQSRAVEQFMQDYYRTIKITERLNEMLVQLLSSDDKTTDRLALAENARFVVSGQYLQAVDQQVFEQYPLALLEVFLELQNHPQLKGIHATTLRQINDHLHLIDDDFRANSKACHLFLSILSHHTGITRVLRMMNRYGILAAYLPDFHHIVGRMQFDLFHTLTVDEHSLFVVRNLRQLAQQQYKHELPFCHDVFSTIQRPYLLYIAGLFHDIGKGRGGNHSEIGAVFAQTFCQQHQMNPHDTQLVVWLVESHLMMSMTAQRMDITDPDVINEFAHKCQTLEKLNYLYLLTVSDIRATNPELWNDWKDSLLKQLYTNTRRAFRRGLTTPLTQQEVINSVQSESRRQLEKHAIKAEAFLPIWEQLNHAYFLRSSVEECVWHTIGILSQAIDEPNDPLVLIRLQSFSNLAEVFICVDHSFPVFTNATRTLDQLGLNIVDVRMLTNSENQIICSFQVIDTTGSNLTEIDRQQSIVIALKSSLLKKTDNTSVLLRSSAKLDHFAIPTQVIFQQEQNPYTLIELISTDNPGLLSKVSSCFDQLGIHIHHAQITTIGARAEDLFYVSNANEQSISPAQEIDIRDALLEAIDGVNTKIKTA